jgi:hypothetical protein
MDNRTDADRTGVDRDKRPDLQPDQPTGTAGRDADLQREGNLGNERNRNTRTDDEEESELGNRPGQNR